uniref:NmrA-like domain-containing protein n=1 Tax=Helicotheca tamesis TaxID=374047 RepID=A0A7S2MZZ5_9STRA|mmetsp:Transcript_6756/g.9123  ORF Transcript_6756/g.9123 Transcript_6756/m.9123 type:complete len:355 (+) Transcript_6756:136-1200(+)|eukprot:CAMPEP_0185727314 /NCGR_PEP_ID=MMETSP1171-20130828/3033_1 /TAXON_ID=374046 /ORGANISM="Helicotheca tamensis, Strain CCMP826" /LENGTH=354 /DNA_ID=CAMNT_0028395845 /DNA_START=136 /DNA_END=1200 /DNA_ORIENTATION=-
MKAKYNPIFYVYLFILQAIPQVLPLALSSSSFKKINEDRAGSVLVVGATGGTGTRALQGLLDIGYKPSQMRLLTRNPQKIESLKEKFGFQICQVDLDDGLSKELNNALVDCVGCYIHSTSSDTRKLDTAEESRARTLAKAMQVSSSSFHVVYNSAAGEPEHGVKRIQQKQDVEKIFREEFPDIPFTSLRANLFMEELWKGYTRPAILKGKFPFSTPSDRKIYLTSVRDMGRIAGTCIAKELYIGEDINIAGDVLSAKQIASAFAEAQQSPCKHSEAKVFGFLAQLFFRDLYEVIRFYRRSTETTDIKALTTKFPGHLTGFVSFLEETDWGNTDLAFDSFISSFLVEERNSGILN